MNTNPDEATLALWLDDELHGEELAAVEAWAANQPEQIAVRAAIRRWRGMISSALPTEEEPPYADFFNSRVARAIRDGMPPSPVAEKGGFSWRSLFMPLTVCAGMVLAFWLGSKSQPVAVPVDVDVAGAPKAIPVEPVVYTPERGVKAEWFASSEASATVIVLNGVEAIPDSMDFSESTFIQGGREMDSTAEYEPEGNDKPGL